MKMIRINNLNQMVNSLKWRQLEEALDSAWEHPTMELMIPWFYHDCPLDPRAPWEDWIFFPAGTHHCPECGKVF